MQVCKQEAVTLKYTDTQIMIDMHPYQVRKGTTVWSTQLLRWWQLCYQ
jgi:hypothetical protein